MIRKSLSIIFVMILITPLHTTAEEVIKGTSEVGNFELKKQISGSYLLTFDVLWNQFTISRCAV